MGKLTEATIQRVIDTVVRETNPEMVYVFGSYGRGDANETSDLDILIVERDEFGEDHSRWSELKRIRKALSEFRVSKDIVVISVGEFEYWKGSSVHLVSHAIRDGRLLYARS